MERTIENPYAGHTIVFTATSAETGGSYVEFEVTILPGGAPIPLHCHPRQSERGRVLEGTLGVSVDSVSATILAGEDILIPIGVAHSLYNAGSVPLRSISRIEPALHFEELLREITAVAVARRRAYPSFTDMAIILGRYPGEMYAGGLPVALQKVLLPLAAFLGRISGRKLPHSQPTKQGLLP